MCVYVCACVRRCCQTYITLHGANVLANLFLRVIPAQYILIDWNTNRVVFELEQFNIAMRHVVSLFFPGKKIIISKLNPQIRTGPRQ